MRHYLLDLRGVVGGFSVLSGVLGLVESRVIVVASGATVVKPGLILVASGVTVVTPEATVVESRVTVVASGVTVVKPGVTTDVVDESVGVIGVEVGVELGSEVGNPSVVEAFAVVSIEVGSSIVVTISAVVITTKASKLHLKKNI